jgi:hypothetical protein
MKKLGHIKISWKDYHTITFFHDLKTIYYKMREMHDSDLRYDYIHPGLIDRQEFEEVMDKIGKWAEMCNSKGGDTGRDHYIIDVR